MNYAIPMDFLNGEDELRQIDPGMVLAKPSLHLLVHHRAHVASRTVVSYHVEVFEGLEGVMQLGYEPMINLALDLFLCYHKSSHAVIRQLLHTFHSIELASPIPVRLKPLD